MMQITLNEAEILEAIEEKVRKQINIGDNQDITIVLRAGRGPDGFTAALDITEKVSSTPAKKKPATRSVAVKETDTETTVGAGCGLPERPEPSTASLFDTEEVEVEDKKDDNVTDVSDAEITLNPENRQEESATSIFG